MKKLLFASSAVALALCSQTAYAQEEPDEGTEEVQAPRGLGTITVTAQRREETLQDAAIPINAATGAELAQAGVVDATTLGKVAPALYVTAGGGANAGYFIRGVGNFTNNGYTSPAVAFNLDGVYIGRPSSTISSFLDLNRVEVLKGPQGTLYGRNSTGGAINVIPNTPVLGELSGSVSGLIGNYDAVQATAVLNMPIGDNTAIRLAGTVNQRDGYNSDGTNDADDMAFRAQIYTELGDNVDIRIAGDYSTQKGIGPGTTVVGQYGLVPPFVPGRLDNPVPGWIFNPAPADVSAPHTGLHTGPANMYLDGLTGAPLFSPFVDFTFPFRNDKYWGINAEVNVDLGGADLTIIPAYRKSSLDNQFNGPPFKAAINQDTAEQFSVEARLSGEVGPLEWLLGGYYFDEQVVGTNSFNQFSTVAHNTFDSQSESLAAFARATFHVSDDLRLVGGVRYTDESRSIDAFATATAGVCFFTPNPGPPNCSHLPTLPNGLTLAETLADLDPALFPGGPAPFLMADPANNFDPNGPNGVGQLFTFGPLLGGGPAGVGAFLAITPNTTQRTGGDSEFTFRAAIEYDVTPDSLLYASFENGFRAGGFNLSFGNEEYDPEFIDAFTIGSKNRFFDDRLELNIEAFYWKYSGQQLAALGTDDNGNNSFFTRNVGESSIKGVDVDFQVAVTDTTLFRGAVQYLDATYDSFEFNVIDLSDGPDGDPLNFLLPVTGCQTTQLGAQPDPDRSFDIDCSGMQALNAPKWTASFGIQQTVELSGDLLLIGNVDGRYQGSREVGFNYIPEGRAPSSFTIDASLTLTEDDAGFSVTAFVQNLTDEAIPALVQLGSGNVVGTNFQPPRTYGIRAGYNF